MMSARKVIVHFPFSLCENETFELEILPIISAWSSTVRREGAKLFLDLGSISG